MPQPDSLETSILVAFQVCCISSSFKLCFFTNSFSGFTCIQIVPIKKQADNSPLEPCFQGQTFKQPSICSLSITWSQWPRHALASVRWCSHSLPVLLSHNTPDRHLLSLSYHTFLPLDMEKRNKFCHALT